MVDGPWPIVHGFCCHGCTAPAGWLYLRLDYYRMRYYLLLGLLLSVGCSFGQAFSYPTIQQKGTSLRDFVPAGWIARDSATGDLNKDFLHDYAVVLQHRDSVSLVKKDGDMEEVVVTQPRMLLLLFRNPADGSLTLVEQSRSFILNHDNPDMDDPYAGLNIRNGVLEIKFHLFYNMGSWYVNSATYKFRYQQGQFVLIGADNWSFHRASHNAEAYSYNFLTRKRLLTKENGETGKKTSEWKPLPLRALKTLKSFREPYSWEVEKDVYL